MSNKNVVIHFKLFQRWLLQRTQDAIFVSNWIMLDLRFPSFKIMILTLIIKRGIGIRILKHDTDFELKNAPQFKLKNTISHFINTYQTGRPKYQTKFIYFLIIVVQLIFNIAKIKLKGLIKMSIALCIGELIFYDVAELEQYHVMKF